jgi:hypothetical protein
LWTRKSQFECPHERPDYGIYWRYYFFETKFIETVRIIFTHPGKLTLAFNSGKRVKYMHPVRMYFGVSAIFFFIMSSDLFKKESNTQQQSKTTIDSLRKAENRDYNSGRNFARQLKKDLSHNLESESDTVSKSNLDEFRKGMKDAQKEYNARKDGSKFYLGLIKKLIIPKDSITYYFQLNDEALDSVLTARGISTFFPVRKTIKNSIVKEYHRYLEEKYGLKSEINGRTMLFNNYLPTIMFILLPFAAYILWFFERRTKWRYYFQHLVFTLYTHSAIFVFWAICEFLNDLYKYFFNQDFYDYSGYIVLFVSSSEFSVFHDFYQKRISAKLGKNDCKVYPTDYVLLIFILFNYPHWNLLWASNYLICWSNLYQVFIQVRFKYIT